MAIKISRQQDTRLTVRSNERATLYALGLALVIGGILILLLVRVQPLQQRDLQLSDILSQQQESAPTFDNETQSFEMEAVALRLTYYTGRLILTRERPIVVGGVVAIVIGLIILISPVRSQMIIFTKVDDEVVIKQPRWFFRRHVDRYPLSNVSDVRVERGRQRGGSQGFGVNLAISYSEGRPLSRDYVHYTVAYPLSPSFRYDYDRASDIARQIRQFLH